MQTPCQVGFILGMKRFFIIHKIKQSHQRTGQKNKIISIDAEKAFDKNSTSIYDKKKRALHKMDIKGTFLNIIKAMWKTHN